MIQVEYEILSPVTEGKNGAQKEHGVTAHTVLNKNLVFHQVLRYGNLEEAFSKADLVVEESFVFESYSAMPLETFSIVAEFNRGTGILTIQDNCQVPMHVASAISLALSIPSNRIRFVEQDIGGGFGVKTMLATYDILVSLLSNWASREFE
jgi:2-furoyl-CoA dehydrogenase large subunit